MTSQVGARALSPGLAGSSPSRVGVATSDDVNNNSSNNNNNGNNNNSDLRGTIVQLYGLSLAIVAASRRGNLAQRPDPLNYLSTAEVDRPLERGGQIASTKRRHLREPSGWPEGQRLRGPDH